MLTVVHLVGVGDGVGAFGAFRASRDDSVVRTEVLLPPVGLAPLPLLQLGPALSHLVVPQDVELPIEQVVRGPFRAFFL